MQFVRRLSAVVVLAASVLFLAAQARAAQEADSAIIAGTVTDSSKAGVTDATVTLTHVATNAITVAHTDERGEYRTPPLRLGEYQVSVEAAGFKRFEQSGVVLNIGDAREVDVVLEVGAVTQTVTVEAAAPLLQTSDSTVGTVITNKQIVDLPLNGRDYLQLASLSSGTTPSTSVSNGVQVGIGIGGQVGTAAAFLLDGVDNNSQTILPTHGNQKEVIKPSVDAIDEFKVVTNGYDAEYGRSSSGIVSVSIKSGTNQLHGSAYEFARDNALDAKNLFANPNLAYPYRRNDFGGSVGTHIIHNKLFFFGDFEFQVIRQSTPSVDTVPTVGERSGQFPSSIPIYDPATHQQFPNNQIPTTGPGTHIDPLALQLINLYPLPQNSSLTNNYIYNSPDNENPRHWDFRVDEILSDKQNMFFRYSSQTQEYDPSPVFPADPTYGDFAAASGSRVDSHGFAFGYNKIWSNNVVSSFRAGWNYLLFYQYYGNNESLNSIFGIPGVNETVPGLANMVITGFTSLGVSNTPNTSGSQDRQLSGDVTWTKGTHTLKFGTQANWLQTNFISSQQIGGIFTFNGEYTRQAASATSTGSALADFLLGDSSSESLSNWAYLAFRTPMIGLFAEDDWRVTSHLTLNLGLRYEINLPPVDVGNKIANFDTDTNPADPQLVAAAPGDRYSEALQTTDNRQFAPRIGFAYSLPDNKTVLRGGYGYFYSNIITSGGMQSLEINPPNHIRINTTANTTTPNEFLNNGFPAGTLTPTTLATNVELVSDETNGVWPRSRQWSFDVQRQLPKGILVEVGYYGNYADHLYWQYDGNQPQPNSLTGLLPSGSNVNANRPYNNAPYTTPYAVPGEPYSITLADIVRIEKDGFSRYNALQAKVEKRYANGLTFIGSYAYSKAIALGDTTGVQDPLDPEADRAVSAFSMANHFVGSAVYALPFGRGKTFGANWNRLTNAVLGGWSLSPIFTVDSGMPINLSVNGDPSNSGPFAADRPNIVGNWNEPGAIAGNPTCKAPAAIHAVQAWFNTCAFVPNLPDQYGDAGRNILRGPGLINLDFAAYKVFQLNERITAQFRAESFNLTNTPALGNPNTVVGSPLFGQITTAGPARENQLGIKILF